MYKIGYEQTDKKVLVDIFGIEFEIKKLNKDLLKEIEDIKDSDTENFEDLYKYVDLFLGEGASDKINAKRKQDGYEPMNYEVIIKLIDIVIGAYKQTYDEVLKYKNKFNNYGNRAYRRRRY